ncbi:hypothetical protein MJL30_38145, partial [Salmonella enterica subsp. enterica serovar Anatum]|nr:hypothetical protein [Salmonella enterica subsp. enterica serovar Anatum]
RAQYDTVLANEVTARNNLDNAVEELRQVTGNYYPELASLNVEIFFTVIDATHQFPMMYATFSRDRRFLIKSRSAPVQHLLNQCAP